MTPEERSERARKAALARHHRAESEPAKTLDQFTDEELHSEVARRRAAKRLTRSGGRTPTCECRLCAKCRQRAATAKWRAKQRS